MATYRINDTQYWRDMVETKQVTGFSLQGEFGFVPVNPLAETTMSACLDDLVKEPS